uniref:MADF domain-containing protein n=1 Tax=Cacopsylla melanoneura TaxID=428564 RepID=A0A8D8QFV8_9HEMI
MTSCTWGYERVFYFIELFKSNPILWDYRHESYHNKLARQEVWVEIASLMGTKVEECQGKLQSLLSSNRREKAKTRKFSGKGDVYKSTWFAFEALKFLDDRGPKRRDAEIPGTSESLFLMDHVSGHLTIFSQ